MFWSWSSVKSALDAIADLSRKLLKGQQTSVDELRVFRNEVNSRLSEIESMLCDLLLRGKPGPIKLVVTGEDHMQKKLRFTLVLPPKAAPDVTSRELSVKIGNADASVSTLSGDTNELTDLEGGENENVEVSLVDIDGAGNRSEISVGNFVLVDTIAPPAPGEIGLKVTSEVFPTEAPSEPEAPADDVPADPAG